VEKSGDIISDLRISGNIGTVGAPQRIWIAFAFYSLKEISSTRKDCQEGRSGGAGSHLVGYFLAALASFAAKVSNRKGCKENQ
jgi:hypothetical protein